MSCDRRFVVFFKRSKRWALLRIWLILVGRPIPYAIIARQRCIVGGVYSADLARMTDSCLKWSLRRFTKWWTSLLQMTDIYIYIYIYIYI